MDVRKVRSWWSSVLAVLLAAAGCTPAGGGGGDGLSSVAGAADGQGAFQRSHVLSDRAFTDTSTLSVEDVKRMLEETPWGESPLATFEYQGVDFSELLHATAVAKQVNPLVLLTVAHQKWSSLGYPKKPYEYIARELLYCACTDTSQAWCPERRFNDTEGLDSCFPDLLRRYYATAGSIDDSNRPWVADHGYGIGATHPATGVTPVNRATVALYPVIVERNATTRAIEEFHGFWHRFVDHYSEVLDRDLSSWLELPPNENYIGGPCQTPSDCVFSANPDDYAGDVPEPQCIRGMCTIACPESRFCPDRPGAVTTFCVEMEGQSRPMCVSKCSATGCGTGFACQEDAGRAGQPDVTAHVCLPEGPESPAVTDPGPPIEDPDGDEPDVEEPAEPGGTQPGGAELTRDVDFFVVRGSYQQGGYWIEAPDRLPIKGGYDRVEVRAEPLVGEGDWDQWRGEIVASASVDQGQYLQTLACSVSGSASASYDAGGDSAWVTPQLFFRHTFKERWMAMQSSVQELALPMRITVECFAAGSSTAEPCFDD